MLKKFEDIFIRFDTVHERAGHTDRQTDTQTLHNDISRAYASHRAAKKIIRLRFVALWNNVEWYNIANLTRT